jgi:hypothetical protein
LLNVEGHTFHVCLYHRRSGNEPTHIKCNSSETENKRK